MQCVRYRGELKVMVTTPGPYHDQFVNFSVAARAPGRRYRGFVYSILKGDAGEPHCILAGPDGLKDPEAYKIIR